MMNRRNFLKSIIGAGLACLGIKSVKKLFFKPNPAQDRLLNTFEPPSLNGNKWRIGVDRAIDGGQKDRYWAYYFDGRWKLVKEWNW